MFFKKDRFVSTENGYGKVTSRNADGSYNVKHQNAPGRPNVYDRDELRAPYGRSAILAETAVGLATDQASAGLIGSTLFGGLAGYGVKAFGRRRAKRDTGY